MRACVERGTAKSAAPRLAGTGWQLAGKTGSGAAGAKPFDGWFAGLALHDGAPRYTIAVFVEKCGHGGGVAAAIAAGPVRELAGAAGR